MANRMPVLFIGHGNPIHTLENNEFTAAWQFLTDRVPRPKTILAISAHSLTDRTFISTSKAPETIHDFYGFPRAMYELRYPCSGDPELAERIIGELTDFSLSPKTNLGLDHGTWCVLRRTFPNADIPVVTLSLHANQTPQYHYELGRALDFLRDENILVMCSGNIVHNLGKAMSASNESIDWAVEFDQRIAEAIIQRDHTTILNYRNWGKLATDAHPTDEHLLPLFYFLGLQSEQDEIIFSEYSEVTLETAFMRSIFMGQA